MNDRQADLLFCHNLGAKGFRPYNKMQFPGLGEVEFISYPWPEGACIYINARTTPGDPMTMQTFRIVGGVLDCTHSYIFPNGNCISCGTFVTSAPGFTRHRVVQRPKIVEKSA